MNEYDKHIALLKYLSKNDSHISFNNGITFNEKNNLLDDKFNKYRGIIAIAPLSSLMNRGWKKEYFTEVVNKLKEHHKIVLLGSKNQNMILKKYFGENTNLEILAGKLSLSEIPILLQKAKLFIGLDSGITHIALKMKTPLVAIIGGGEFGRFFPYQESKLTKFLYHKLECFLCHWECSQTEMSCILGVTPEKVLQEVNKILNDEHAY